MEMGECPKCAQNLLLWHGHLITHLDNGGLQCSGSGLLPYDSNEDDEGW